MKDSASTERELASGEARAYPAMAFEMSESGMSAATTNHLHVGDKVDLSPVATYRVSAIVRRRTGSMYGFEFVELIEKQQKGIHELCKDLPLFRSVLDI